MAEPTTFAISTASTEVSASRMVPRSHVGDELPVPKQVSAHKDRDDLPHSRDAYDLWHHELPVDAHADTPWHHMLKPYLLREPMSHKQVLEIGCGRGEFSCWLATNTEANVTAADFSQTAVARGRACAASIGVNIRWRVMDINSIAYPDSAFDYVISCETIEHVLDPARALTELARVLKPGGKLFLTTPNYLNLIGLYRGYMRLKGTPFTEVGQPINRFVMLPRTLAWVRKAGLRIVHSESQGMYMPIPGRPWTAVPVLERRRLLSRWTGMHSMVIAQK